MTINSFRGYYYFLSNFSLHRIIISDVETLYKGIWQTAEHLYQAMKTQDSWHIRGICDASSPRKAKKLGNKAPLRRNWENVKYQVMYFVVKEKFSQNPDIKQKLIGTGSEELVEGNWWGDAYWGVCNNKGLNELGHILMAVRREFTFSNNNDKL